MTRKKKKHELTPLKGRTVAEIIELLKQMPQDSILIIQDGDGGVLPVVGAHKGIVYHSHPGAQWIGQYSFISQKNIDHPLPDDENFYASQQFQDTKRSAVELS